MYAHLDSALSSSHNLNSYSAVILFANIKYLYDADIIINKNLNSLP